MSPSSLPEFPAIFHDSYRPSFWRSHPVFVSVVGFLILCALVLIGGLLVSIQTVDATLRGRDALLQAREHVFALELGDARQSLLEADDAFRSARRSTRLLSPVRLIPGIGRYHEVGVLFLESADHMTQILLSALGSLEDATRLVDDLPSLLRAELVDGEVVSRWSALPEQSRRLFLERLAASVPEMQVRSAELDVTLAKLEHTLAQPIAAVLASPLSRVFHELVRARDDLNRFIQAASLVPLLSNASGQSRILVLFLNDTELRPGGGFLGSFAIIHLNAGLLQSIESYDVLALDAPVLRTRTLFPPPPLAEYLDVPAWFVRDANWSPDIPTSMDWTLRFYAQELDEAGSAARVPEGPPFDAVVGVTTRFASDLLRILGDVRVGGQTFTADNIEDTLEYAVELGFAEEGIPRDQRKEVIGEILEVISDRLHSIGPSEWNALLEALARRVREKHVFFYSEKEDLQAWFDRMGWTARIKSDARGDYLMVVDANLAALKTDPAIIRDLTYELAWEGRDLVATARMHYAHTKGFDWKTTRYRTYTRFFVPLGSELISAEGTLKNDKIKNTTLAPDTVDVLEEHGKTVFGMFTSIEPKSEGELVVRYRLPRSLAREVERGHYQLDLQKQPGAEANGLTLDLHFGTNLSRAVPPEEPSHFGDERYTLNTILDQDKTFVVDLSL